MAPKLLFSRGGKRQLLPLVLEVLCLSLVADAAPKIFGILQESSASVTNVEKQAAYSQCFGGLGLIRCKANKDADDGYLLADIEQYNDINNNYGVAPWCLACCSHSLGNEIDTWDLGCELDARTQISSNVFGYEFRIARMKSSSDKEIFRCPITRSGCTYDASGEVAACPDQNLFLSGYELTLHVRERYESFNLWLEVLSCETVVQESSQAVDTVSEKVIMVHRPSGDYEYDPFAVIALFFGLSISIHILLRVLRSNRCDICDGRLVYSRKTCVWCRFYGTAPLNPKVLKELRNVDVPVSAETTACSTPREGEQAHEAVFGGVDMDATTSASENVPTTNQASGINHPHAEGSDWRRGGVRRHALAHAYSFRSAKDDTWVPQELMVPSRGGKRSAIIVPV